MKQRFSSLDVKIIAHELSTQLVSLRLANVYDLSSRIYLLKFAKPDHREQLIIDSGFRCHLTSFTRATAAAPTAFVAKLRKYLRTRRVTAVSQVGTDRVIEIQFSDGSFRLYLEFYAGGNIILTDGESNILALWRNVSEGEEHEQYRPGVKYDLSQRQNYGGVPALTRERVRNGLINAIAKQAREAEKPGKKIKKKPGDALRRALAITTFEFPPILLDHALTLTSFDKTTPPEKVVEDEETLSALMNALETAAKVIQEITSAEIAKGYILAKRRGGTSAEASAARQDLIYDDFHPFKPAQLAADKELVFLEYDGFNKSVDEFFSSIEGQKLESRLQEREDTAHRKIEQARQEQAKRIDGLQQVQELNVRKAQAIEANVERVEEAIAAVNGLVAQSMDWVDIGHLIENEQARNNPVAKLIKLPLKLEENTITLLLSELATAGDDDMADETDSDPDSEDDDDASTKPSAKSAVQPLAIDIDLAYSPWSNARAYYENRRAAAVKQEKTSQASEKALKSTEQKVMADLKKGLKQEKDVLRPVRKQMWFEKFIYFISSDGYLVIAGKDAQQNEILYRRYLKKGDIYVHADLHGAATVVIKNNPATPNAPIPPSTLSQAGSLAVCTSGAWDSKAVMPAWWVNSDQVSKTAPTGEYLSTGGFMIRGKKNFLPPAQLLLGFAILFQISEESKAKHVKHRLRDEDAGSAQSQDKVEDKIGEDDDHDDDDEFPDAQHEDDDDDFPDADDIEQQTHDTEADDTLRQNHDIDADDTQQQNHDTDADDTQQQSHDTEDEYHHRPASSNPLQRKSQSDVEESASDSDGDEPVDATADKQTATTEAKQSKQNGANASTSRPSTSKSVPRVRGKRGKAKKIATKYAEQDDEDRELAMQLLGSKAADDRRKDESAENAAKQETAEEARARRKAQHDKVQKEGLEAEEIRRLNLEEGVEDLNEEESLALTQLDALVGTPLAGDEILEAIPVCAPWNALGKYKYKVKLQPGQQKKGKAVREILGKWTSATSNPKALDQSSQDTEKIWPREADLIKAWREPEVLGVIPVKSVRVVMSGGLAGSGGDKKGGRSAKSGRGGRGSKKAR